MPSAMACSPLLAAIQIDLARLRDDPGQILELQPTLIAMALINCMAQNQFEFGAIGQFRQQCERLGIR
jgi:hypothetical protein